MSTEGHALKAAQFGAAVARRKERRAVPWLLACAVAAMAARSNAGVGAMMPHVEADGKGWQGVARGNAGAF